MSTDTRAICAFADKVAGSLIVGRYFTYFTDTLLSIGGYAIDNRPILDCILTNTRTIYRSGNPPICGLDPVEYRPTCLYTIYQYPFCYWHLTDILYNGKVDLVVIGWSYLKSTLSKEWKSWMIFELPPLVLNLNIDLYRLIYSDLIAYQHIHAKSFRSCLLRLLGFHANNFSIIIGKLVAKQWRNIKKVKKSLKGKKKL